VTGSRPCNDVERHAPPRRRVLFRFLLLLVDLASQPDSKVVTRLSFSLHDVVADPMRQLGKTPILTKALRLPRRKRRGCRRPCLQPRIPISLRLPETPSSSRGGRGRSQTHPHVDRPYTASTAAAARQRHVIQVRCCPDCPDNHSSAHSTPSVLIHRYLCGAWCRAMGPCSFPAADVSTQESAHSSCSFRPTPAGRPIYALLLAALPPLFLRTGFA
jgi:hypothetical protein